MTSVSIMSSMTMIRRVLEHIGPFKHVLSAFALLACWLRWLHARHLGTSWYDTYIIYHMLMCMQGACLSYLSKEETKTRLKSNIFLHLFQTIPFDFTLFELNKFPSERSQLQ